MSSDSPSVRASAVKFGIAAVVCIVLLGLLITTLGNYSAERGHTYKAEFSDAIGARARDDVRIAGVTVGRIDGVSLKHGHAVISFTVRGHVGLTQATEASLRYRNLLGQRYLALSIPNGSAADLRPGSTIPLAQTHPALNLTDVLNGFKPLFQGLQPKQVNELAAAIVATLQGEGGNIGSLLSQTADLTSTLATRDVAIGELVDNLSKVVGTVAAHDAGLGTLVDQLGRLTHTLAADRGAIGDSISGVDALSSSLTSLLVDARPPLRSLIRPLDTTVGLLAAKQAQLDKDLKALPVGLAALSRATSYGSWINVYVCDLSAAAGTVSVPVGGSQHSAVCR